MGTKNNPNEYDCYERLEGDEPFFVLRGKDPIGSHLVDAWVCLRAGDTVGAERAIEAADLVWRREVMAGRRSFLAIYHEKSMEASQCGREMRIWFERLKDKV